MRVTESLFYGRMLQANTGARSRLDQASTPLMSGVKHSKPSEDPMYAQRLEGMRRGQREAERMQDGIARLRGYHEMVDSTASSVVDTLNELSTLAVQMSNDSMNGADRAVAAEHVSHLVEHLRSTANTSYEGRYLFSGRLENTPPYDPDFNYQGDGTPRALTVGAGVTLPSDVLATELFGDPAAGEVTAFQAAQNLLTALQDNDGDAIAAALGEVKGAHEKAVHARTRAGMVLNDLQQFDEYHEEQRFTYQMQESELASVDVAEAASKLAFAEHVYQAALTTSGRLSELLKAELRL